MTAITASAPRLTTRVAVVVVATVVLGFPGGLACLGVMAWSLLATPTRARVLTLAGLLLVATTVAWIAAGVPTAQQVAVFTNLGGRGWLDGLARFALGVAAGTLCGVPDHPRATASTSAAVGPETRLPEVDRMRAIAIVTVVFIHGLPFRAPITDYLDYWLSDLTRFAVPTLLVLAGWLVPRRAVGWQWVGRRLGRLLPAYFIAATVMIVLARLTPSIDARPVLQSLAFGDAVGPHYFIPVLVLLILATPLFMRLPTRWLVALTVAAVVGSLVVEVADLSLYAHNHLPLTWLPWYLVGIVARPHRDRLVDLAATWWLPTLLAATTVAVAVMFAPVETTPRRVLTWVAMWAVVAALAMGTLHLPGPTTGVTDRLSSSSYVIYLYHPPVMAGLTGLFGSAVITLRPVTATVVAVTLGVVAAHLATVAFSPRGARRFGASP